MEVYGTFKCLKFLVKGLKVIHDTSLAWHAAWVGWRICVCRFVGICYHVPITETVAPESLGGRQPTVRPRWFQVPCSGARPVVCFPLLMLVCLVSRRATDVPAPKT